LVAAAIASAEQGLTRLVADVAANAVLRRRDYTFCLFPELTLRPFLTQVES
jgi:hypothetical protein